MVEGDRRRVMKRVEEIGRKEGRKKVREGRDGGIEGVLGVMLATIRPQDTIH